MVEMFTTGDLTGLSAVVSSRYQDHQEPDLGTGAEVFARVVTRLRHQFPDLRVSVEDIIAQGGKVVLRLSWTGTASNGERFTAKGIDIVRVSGARAAEHWGVSDGWP